MDDDDIILKAFEENWILITNDKDFGEKVYRSRIPRNVRLSEAPSHGQPILLYDIHSRGAVAYLKLAEEILAGLLEADRPSEAPPEHCGCRS